MQGRLAVFYDCDSAAHRLAMIQQRRRISIHRHCVALRPQLLSEAEVLCSLPPTFAFICQEDSRVGFCIQAERTFYGLASALLPQP